MAAPSLSKMKRADVLEELARVYDYAEPPNHNLQMLKSILGEQRIFRQAQSLFKLAPMPTRKVDIINALKEEGYDMARLTGRENNSLLQRRLLFMRPWCAREAIEDAQQAVREALQSLCDSLYKEPRIRCRYQMMPLIELPNQGQGLDESDTVR